MATERIPTPAPIPAIPADDEALAHYQALDDEQRAALDALIADAQDIAERYNATLRLDWWVDAEVEDWENFVVRVRTEPATRTVVPRRASACMGSIRTGRT